MRQGVSRLRVWECSTGERVLLDLGVAWLEEDTLLTLTSEESTDVFNLDQGESSAIATRDGPVLSGPSDLVAHDAERGLTAFTHEDGTIAIASIRLIDGQWVAELTVTLAAPTSAVHSADFSRDGRAPITSNVKGPCLIWDLEAGVSLVTLPEQSQELIFIVPFFADNSRVAVGRFRRPIAVYDASNGRYLLTLHESNARLSVSRSGERFIAASRW